MAKTIRQDAKGNYYRNLGYLGNGQPKFYLGKDRVLAEERIRRIERLWDRIAAEHSQGKAEGLPRWPAMILEAAKSIARGDAFYAYTADEGITTPQDYAQTVQWLAAMWPEINWRPADMTGFIVGQRQLAIVGDKFQAEAERLQDKAAGEHLKATVFKSLAGQTAKPLKIIGGSLHKAITDYITWIEGEYFDTSEQHINDNGKTKIRQARAFQSYLPDVALSHLDYEKCDELFGILRKRPITERYGTPMKRKSCSNYIGELDRLFRWIDTSKKYDWELPPKYDRIKRTPNKIESDARDALKAIFVYSIEQLKTLYRYATPIERFFMLLGLNCAFGADQSGRVRIDDFQFGERSYVAHLRTKKEVMGGHLVWRHTEIMVKWMLARHANPQPGDKLAIKHDGRAYYEKTAGGNRRRDIPKHWTRLIQRIRKDDEAFPNTGFNVLRDTSTDMIRQLAGGELASLHCTHKHQTDDKNLNPYSNPRRAALYVAQEQLERNLADVFAEADDPTKPNPQAYVTLKTIDKVRAMNEDGYSVAEIAAAADISRAAVYRHLERLGAKT